jgi:hypothetical protein
MKRYGSLPFFIVVALCMIDPPADAADVSPVGTWRVKSFSQQILDTNETIRPYGDNPVAGYIQYSPGGYMVVFLSVGNPKKPASFPFTDAERAEIHKGIFGAYAGRYSVEGTKVTHHIEVSWRPDWIGDNQVRYLEIDGSKLTIKTAPLISALSGKQVVSILTFERAD